MSPKKFGPRMKKKIVQGPNSLTHVSLGPNFSGTKKVEKKKQATEYTKNVASQLVQPTPPIHLHLIFEISSLKNPVCQTRIFELDI